LQLIKIENDFVREFGIKQINSRVDADAKIKLTKVISSAQISYKNVQELYNYAKILYCNFRLENNKNI